MGTPTRTRRDWASVSVGSAVTADPDIVIGERGYEIRLATDRLSTKAEAVTFRNEQT